MRTGTASRRTSGPTRRSTVGGWTSDEDTLLAAAVKEKGKDWKTIAELFPGRTGPQCNNRWTKVLDPDITKGAWTKEEDDIVFALVEKNGPDKWAPIANNLPGRNGKQCRERWENHLNPLLNKGAWTTEEDRILIHEHKNYGNKWAKLAKLLPGRSANSIKNHWNCNLKKKYGHVPEGMPESQSETPNAGDLGNHTVNLFQRLTQHNMNAGSHPPSSVMSSGSTRVGSQDNNLEHHGNFSKKDHLQLPMGPPEITALKLDIPSSGLDQHVDCRQNSRAVKDQDRDKNGVQLSGYFCGETSNNPSTSSLRYTEFRILGQTIRYSQPEESMSSMLLVDDRSSPSPNLSLHISIGEPGCRKSSLEETLENYPPLLRKSPRTMAEVYDPSIAGGSLVGADHNGRSVDDGYAHEERVDQLSLSLSNSDHQKRKRSDATESVGKKLEKEFDKEWDGPSRH